MSVEKVLIGNSEFIPSIKTGGYVFATDAKTIPCYMFNYNVNPYWFNLALRPEAFPSGNIMYFYAGTFMDKAGTTYINFRDNGGGCYLVKYHDVEALLKNASFTPIGGVIKALYNKLLSYFHRLEVA